MTLHGQKSMILAKFSGSDTVMALVGIDTQIVAFWEQIDAGLPAVKTGGSEVARCRYAAKAIRFALEQENATVVISAISIAELLVVVDHPRHAQTLAAYASNYYVKEFDIQSAAVAARLYQMVSGTPAAQHVQKQRLWNDLKIIGTIKAAGASKFISLDEKCKNIASKIMPAEGAPTHIYDLFEDQDPQQSK